jgi:transposase InsO family protein
MKDLLMLLVHLLTTIAKLLGPGGAKAVVADSLLMKQQLLVINRTRRRAPNLSAFDRFLFGFWSLFLNPHRLRRAAVIIRPSTFFRFHDTLKKRKYRLLYSSGSKGKPGPKGPSRELILSSDNDSLFRYQRWQANLRILGVDEIKSIPCTPSSHPFIERLIGTIRREYLDHILFWNAQDLERKLVVFRQYYNRDRVHQSLGGDAPDEVSGVHQPLHAKLSNYS